MKMSAFPDLDLNVVPALRLTEDGKHLSPPGSGRPFLATTAEGNSDSPYLTTFALIDDAGSPRPDAWLYVLDEAAIAGRSEASARRTIRRLRRRAAPALLAGPPDYAAPFDQR